MVIGTYLSGLEIQNYGTRILCFANTSITSFKLRLVSSPSKISRFCHICSFRSKIKKNTSQYFSNCQHYYNDSTWFRTYLGFVTWASPTFQLPVVILIFARNLEKLETECSQTHQQQRSITQPHENAWGAGYSQKFGAAFAKVWPRWPQIL